MAKLTFLATALVTPLAIGSDSAQRKQNLRRCQMYFAQEREYYSVATVTDRNPQQQQHLHKCGQQLQNIEKQCRCEGVRTAVRQQQGRREQEEMMMQKAQDLPSRCNLSPCRCEIQAD